MAEAMITRKTVPLTPKEVDLVERAREAGTAHHDALVKLVGAEALRSEAATLHALLGLALNQLGDEVAAHDYARLADAQDEEDEAFNRAMRQRGQRRR